MKELTPPQRLFSTEILKRRLTFGHSQSQEVEKDLAKKWAGYWGEIALANYVKELPQDKYLIFHDLPLQFIGSSLPINILKEYNLTTQKILLRLNFPSTAKTKNRLYHLCPEKVTACVLS